MAKNYDDIGGVWRTIGGRKVFIKTGQSLPDAMKESGKFKPKYNKKTFANNEEFMKKQQDKVENENIKKEIEEQQTKEEIKEIDKELKKEGKLEYKERNKNKEDYIKTFNEKYNNKEFYNESTNEVINAETMANEYIKYGGSESFEDFAKRRTKGLQSRFKNYDYEKNMPEGAKFSKMLEDNKVRTLSGDLEKDNKGRVVSQDKYDKFREAYKNGEISKEDYRNDNYDALKEKEIKVKGDSNIIPRDFKKGYGKFKVETNSNKGHLDDRYEITKDDQGWHAKNLRTGETYAAFGEHLRNNNVFEFETNDNKTIDQLNNEMLGDTYKGKGETPSLVYSNNRRIDIANNEYGGKTAIIWKDGKIERETILPKNVKGDKTKDYFDKYLKELDDDSNQINNSLRRKAYQKYLKEHPASKISYEDFLKK